MVIPMLHENSSMMPDPKFDYIECAFGISFLACMFISLFLHASQIICFNLMRFNQFALQFSSHKKTLTQALFTKHVL